MMNPDVWLFHKINAVWTNDLASSFFPWYTNVQRTWAFLWLILPVILLAVIWHRGVKGFFVLALGSLAAWAVDPMLSAYVKPIFMRSRPFAAGLPFEVIVRVSKPGAWSFPSTHAADAFFLATFFSFYFPRLRWLFLTLAFLTAYSRVYCGVHYPLDVLGGAFIGSVLAKIFLFIINRLPFVRGLK